MKSGNKNDLFVSDRQSRNAYDFEGSGVGNGRYDENVEWREKIRDSTLPIVLLIVTTIFTVFFMKEIFRCVYIINHYTKGVVEQGTWRGNEFRTPDGVAHTVAPNMDVYYLEDNYDNYEEIPKTYILVLGIVVIVVIYILIIRSLYKIFHKTHHSEEDIYQYEYNKME